MSLKTMPILFLNMGGEMVYILEQRLQAQNVRQDKATKVMTDIVGTMFSKKFLEELFKTQELYSRRSMRSLFEKLAHASIMRLNATSMDKLYDLMTMAVKYQLQSCVSPKDILFVTLNHLDGIRKLVQGVANVQSQIDHAYSLMARHYFELGPWQLITIRSTLLNFYQDARVKVSLLLREKKQRDDGRFVISSKNAKSPFGGCIPGAIKYYNKGKVSQNDSFNSGGSYVETVQDGSLTKTAKAGERATDLGTNMYKNAAAMETQGGMGSVTGQEKGGAKVKETQVKDELKLLSHLLMPKGDDITATKGTKSFSLSFFDTEEDEQDFIEQAEQSVDEGLVVKIDASKRDRRDVQKMVGDMSVKDQKKSKKPKGDELLELMDSTENK